MYVCTIVKAVCYTAYCMGLALETMHPIIYGVGHKKFPLKNKDRAIEILGSVSMSVPLYKFSCFLLLLRGRYNALAMVEKTVKEWCKER